MAWAFRSKANATAGASVTSIVLSAPAGVALGDAIVVVICVKMTSGTPTFTPPTGFTQVNTSSSGANGAATFIKVGTSSEPANYTFSFTSNGASGTVSANVAAYSGTSAGVDASSQQANTTTTSVTAPGVTTGFPNELLIWCGVSVVGATTFTAPSGFTLRDQVASTGASSAICDISQTSPGATGSVVGTISSAQNNSGFLLAIAPPQSGNPLFFGSM